MPLIFYRRHKIKRLKTVRFICIFVVVGYTALFVDVGYMYLIR